MQTADEIFESKRYYNKWMEELNDYEKLLIIEIIKEAQKEAIEECASIAEKEIVANYNPLGEDVRQSILKLIDQIK